MRLLMIGVFALVLASSVQASSLRFDGVLINEGKPVTLLLEHMGRPMYRTRDRVCSEGTSSHCRRWTHVENWMYRYNDLNYTIQVRDGVIQRIEWSRF